MEPEADGFALTGRVYSIWLMPLVADSAILAASEGLAQRASLSARLRNTLTGVPLSFATYTPGLKRIRGPLPPHPRRQENAVFDLFGENHPHDMPSYFFWRHLRLDYASAVRADTSKQDFTVAPRHHLPLCPMRRG